MLDGIDLCRIVHALLRCNVKLPPRLMLVVLFCVEQYL
jgi:hypothetical protein